MKKSLVLAMAMALGVTASAYASKDCVELTQELLRTNLT